MGGFDYPNEFAYEAEMAGMSVAGVFLGVYLLFILVAMAFSVVSYVFYSLGLHTIANRRGIKHGWLAWLPLGNVWILGSISDQYQYVTKGKVKNRRKLLLGLEIGLYVLSVVWLVSVVVSAVMSEEFVGGWVAFALIFILGYLAFFALAIVNVVYVYICLYDLYNSSKPNDSVLFLVFSILFSVTMPFFVFSCRNKELGMPPRKQPEPQPVVIPTVEPIVDPTVVEKVVIPTVEPVVDPAIVEKVVVPTVEPVTEEGFAQPEEFEEFEE